jgi:hypothetical protein
VDLHSMGHSGGNDLVLGVRRDYEHLGRFGASCNRCTFCAIGLLLPKYSTVMYSNWGIPIPVLQMPRRCMRRCGDGTNGRGKRCSPVSSRICARIRRTK